MVTFAHKSALDSRANSQLHKKVAGEYYRTWLALDPEANVSIMFSKLILIYLPTYNGKSICG
jgi:hypothetical protein